ncbi:TPR repeat-containing protein [Cryptosporidium canis]|uniref:TPR repeat-containing protein n=1 Tax=Cryptosporidium canis TaxID=195482 RepID=A0A9D5DLC0_9CRYT|nr:TPR repeat-containing protein [Cryptosporidium canis]
MELVSRLKDEGFTIESWHMLALRLYGVGELDKCETILQECIEEHELLEERPDQSQGGQSEASASQLKDALKTVGMLTMLELNLALDCFETNFRRSESILRRSEDRLKQFMRVYTHAYTSLEEFKAIHKYWGFLYLYKSAMSGKINIPQKNSFLDQADREFTLVLEHNPKDAQAISGLANVLYQKAAYHRALRLFSTLLLGLGTERCPNTVRLAMACCYLRIGKPKKAQECCMRAIHVCVFGAKGEEHVDEAGERRKEGLFVKDGSGVARLNRCVFEDGGMVGSMSQFERQTLSDLLLCYSKSTDYKGLSLRDALQMVARIFPRHPILVLYAGNAEFYLGSGPSSSIERELQSISRRCSNLYCSLEAHLQIAKRLHVRKDMAGASMHYSAVVDALRGSYKADKTLLSLYLSGLLGAIRTSCGLQKWDLAAQYIHMAFDALGIKGSAESLLDYNLPIEYLYDFLVPTISLVIMSTEDPALIPITTSIFSQLTVDERLLNCLHHLLFVLDRLGDIDSEQCYTVVFLLQKTLTCLLSRGRKTIRRSDFNYKVIGSLISRYTGYAASLSPLPLVVLLSSCLKYVTTNIGTLAESPGVSDEANPVINSIPCLKYMGFVRENFGIYLNNLAVCMMECATSLSPEHCSQGGNEQAMLDGAMRTLGQSKEWQERTAGVSSNKVVEITIRFNSAICHELRGFYANANDEYKRLSSEFPWFTSAWLRRACLALERSDFQLAAQYCELSLNSKAPEAETLCPRDSACGYSWVPGIGSSHEAACLLLSHIYSCQRRPEKSFAALSKVIKSRNPHYSSIGKVLLGMALYSKAKSQAQSGYSGEMSMYNPTSVQSRLVLSEVLRHETHNYIASNIILIQVAECGLLEHSKDIWKHMTDISSAVEGTAPHMHYVALINLGVLHAVLLAISTQRSPPPAQHNLTLKSIVDDNQVGGVDGGNEILGSHPHFVEQKRIMKTAVKLFQQALQFDPTEKMIHMSLIRCCFDMNMWEDARRLLEKATLRWPSDLTFRIGLTYCLERLVYSEMGDMERAKHPGRVKYWMILCEAVGGFYHWLSIIKETFQVVDMKFIGQIKSNKMSISSLEKYAPGIVRYGQDNKIVLNTENKDEFRYKLPTIPLEGTDLLPSSEYLTKQELIMSRKLYSRFEELLPIVEQVYEKEQRDVEELRIRSEGFRRKQEEERRQREEEEKAASERIKLLSIELGKEAESIAASLPDIQVEKRTKPAKRERGGSGFERLDGPRNEDDLDYDESVIRSESDSYSDSGSGSDSDSQSDARSGSDLDDDAKESKKPKAARPSKHKEKINRKKDRGKSGKSGGGRNPHSSDGEPELHEPRVKKSKRPKDAKKSKREEKRLLKLRRLEEQTAALLEEEYREGFDHDGYNEERAHPDQMENQGRSRLKKRRFDDNASLDDSAEEEGEGEGGRNDYSLFNDELNTDAQGSLDQPPERADTGGDDIKEDNLF